MALIRTKICCIRSKKEADLAIAMGASALGFVSTLTGDPSLLDDSTMREIMSGLPPALGSFLLTCKTDVQSIIEQQRFCRANTLQLCVPLKPSEYAALIAALPGICLVQVLHIRGEESVEDARQLSPCVHALVLDTGSPDPSNRELGGTGRTHDWTISQRICRESQAPVFLAGGLHSSNVQQAITIVRPYGVDVCTGVRTDGQLDSRKLKDFMSAIDQITINTPSRT